MESTQGLPICSSHKALLLTYIPRWGVEQWAGNWGDCPRLPSLSKAKREGCLATLVILYTLILCGPPQVIPSFFRRTKIVPTLKWMGGHVTHFWTMKCQKASSGRLWKRYFLLRQWQAEKMPLPVMSLLPATEYSCVMLGITGPISGS